MGMGNLQRMAMQMQQEMARVQAELETLTVDGSAGGGVVKATVTGKQELVGVTIDPSAVDPEDVEMLQDLVVSAVNEALRASQDLAAERMAAVTGGLKIPGLGVVIGLAMVCNLIAGALGGILIPIVLDRVRADPAVASGTFVTTITDVVGFFSFLGIATLWFGLK